MNIYGINKLLKQRPPFQMIERVTDYVPGEYMTGTKTVSINDPWFVGHFPDTPILPGVLIIEACAQLCSVAAQVDEAEAGEGAGGGMAADKLKVLLKVDGFKFLKPVIPGDVMTITVSKKGKGSILIAYECRVEVAGEIRSKGTITFTEIDSSVVMESGNE